jgi:hypothetical protein
MFARVADGTGTMLLVGSSLGGLSSSSASVFVLVVVIIITRLLLASPHPNISSNTNSASLLSDSPAKGGAFCKTRELLGAVHVEWTGLDLHSPVKRCTTSSVELALNVRLRIEILVLLSLFIKVEGETVAAFVSD